MAGICISLVWLGLFWFGLILCLKKNRGENTGGEKAVGEKT